MGFVRHFFSGSRQEVNITWYPEIEEPIKSREKHYSLVLYILMFVIPYSFVQRSGRQDRGQTPSKSNLVLRHFHLPAPEKRKSLRTKLLKKLFRLFSLEESQLFRRFLRLGWNDLCRLIYTTILHTVSNFGFLFR